MSVSQIFNMKIISNCRAVRGWIIISKNLKLLDFSCSNLTDKRNQIIWNSVWILPNFTTRMGSDWIKITKDCGFQLMICRGLISYDSLNHKLCSSIGAGNMTNRKTFINWNFFRFSVNGTWRAENQNIYLRQIHLFKQDNGSGDIVVVVSQGIFGWFSNRLQCSEVNNCKDVVMVGKNLFQNRPII